MRGGPVALLLMLALSWAAALAFAQGRSFERARSALVARGTSVRVSPDEDADQRGTVRGDARLPVLEVRATSDRCRQWVRVGTEAWICGAELEPSGEAPAGRTYPRLRPGEILPHRYARIGRDGADGFLRPEDVAAGSAAKSYRPGFMFVATMLRPRDGVRLVRMRDGHYVRREAVTVFGDIRFEGVRLREGDGLAPIAWAVPPYERGRRISLEVLSRPGGPVERRHRPLDLLRIAGDAGGGYLRLAEGGVVLASHVRRPTVAPPPEGLRDGERWIDIDREQQTLVAYEGTRPVFATLVSSGQRRRDRETRPGIFRIWIKIASTNMDDVGNPDPGEDYSVEEVPWVQYFDDDNGLHAAYWHRSFGRPVSHGCVNLAPMDARFMFDWTTPALPAGWFTVRPSASETATLVRVR